MRGQCFEKCSDHSGAALFNGQGELVGIGSLYMADVTGPEEPLRRPGNMFVPVDGLPPIADELRAHLRDFAEQGHISRWAVPEHIRFVDALARTSVGKLNKRALREQFVQQSQG